MKTLNVNDLEELILQCDDGKCPPNWEDCFDCAECTFKETLKFLKDKLNETSIKI